MRRPSMGNLHVAWGRTFFSPYHVSSHILTVAEKSKSEIDSGVMIANKYAPFVSKLIFGCPKTNYNYLSLNITKESHKKF